MITEERLLAIAGELAYVHGVVGVVLGGSRARGEHHAASDVDLGIYYRHDLDTDALGTIAARFGGLVSPRGGWGPWVDGGGWLTIDETAVDWIYRDLDRVERSWVDATAGSITMHTQLGHPAGVSSFAYAGELAIARVLADPSGELSALQRSFAVYPPALRSALVERLGEADFTIAIARKAVQRVDSTYIAGCLFSVVMTTAHALHGASERWLINEKGAVAASDDLDVAPDNYAQRAHALLASLGESHEELSAAIDAASALVADTRKACG